MRLQGEVSDDGRLHRAESAAPLTDSNGNSKLQHDSSGRADNGAGGVLSGAATWLAQKVRRRVLTFNLFLELLLHQSSKTLLLVRDDAASAATPARNGSSSELHSLEAIRYRCGLRFYDLIWGWG